MTKKDIEQLFNILCEEAKNINAWEALELIQQAQVAFDCAYDSFNDQKIPCNLSATVLKYTYKLDYIPNKKEFVL